MNKPSRSVLLFFILFGTMFIFGYIENIKGVSYPLIKTEFGISYERQGVMVSLLYLGYVLFCLVGGILLGRFGVKKAITAGFVFVIAGLAGTFFMPGFLPVAGTLFIVSSAFGLFEVSLNALAAQLFITRAALLMNILNFFYGLGSILSPRVAGVLAAARGWRMAYFLSIPVVLVFFIPSLFTRFPGLKGEGREKTIAGPEGGTAPDSALGDTLGDTPDSPADTAKPAVFSTALRTPVVWIFSAVLGLMVTVETCSANWAGLYFQDVYNLDSTTLGAAFISNFFILFTISRLVSGFAIEKIGYLRSLLIAASVSLAIFIAGFALGAKGIYVLPALGFFTAIFWPTTLATAMRYFREDAPVMTSAIIVIGGALNSGIQLFIGLINRVAGPGWGYRSCLLYTLLIIVVLAILPRYMRQPYKR